MIRTKGIHLLLLFLLHVQALSAHVSDSLCSNLSCSCAHAPLPPGIMLGHLHNRNEWMVSYRYMHMGMQGLTSGTNTMEKEEVFTRYLMAPDDMRMNMHMVMVMYGISNKLTLMAMGSFNTTGMNMSMFAMSTHHHAGAATEGTHSMHTKGIGDLKVHALWGLVKKETHQLIVSLGMNLPTGSTNLKGEDEDMMYAGQRLPYAMQTGSGTVDALPGLTYLYNHQQLSFGAQATAVIRPMNNSVGYRWGNELNLNTWVAYQWWNFLGLSARAEGLATGNMHGNDPSLYKYNEPAANAYNHGGQRLNGFAGLYLKGRSGAWSQHMLAVEYGVPVYQNLNGIQMTNRQMINAAWSLTF